MRIGWVTRRRRAGWAMTVLLVCGLAVPVGGKPADPARFVGGQVCTTCHAAEAKAWQGSHHARAMQPATPDAVLGDFSASFEHAGLKTTFGHTGDGFQVSTEGPDGTLHDYPIAYTFGVYPLQQYLIALPGGRLQTLGIAWDSRAQLEGGQRWFQLDPDRPPRPGDRLHWTGRDQTWNYMCADCHSTGVRKGFNLATNAYDTTWSDVNVSCEACHGPGSRHVTVAGGGARDLTPDAAAAAPAARDRHGLVKWLEATAPGTWKMNAGTGIAERAEPPTSAELDTCAGCHARRKEIADIPDRGAPLLDSYLPALLVPGLYHADGQIDGEVFEYGSFLQSRMYRAGVICSDCHEPHSLGLRAEGNGLCAQCHMPAKFDVAEHHHHQPGSAGAQCANCHMPVKTYMGVDARRDHSFRVPRPDLSVSIGTPNTCNQCHANRTAEWAATTVADWFPNGRHMSPHYGTALQAGRLNSAGAETLLDALIGDQRQPAIARASALLLLPSNATSASSAALLTAVADPSPLVRMAAPRALPASPTAVMAEAVAPLLADPVRAVRVEAARALAGVDPRAMTAEQQSALAAASAELVAAEATDADRPEAHLNLGLLAVRRRRPDEAEAEYRTALRLDPIFVPAMVNLADLARMRGMDDQAAALLRQAVATEPGNAEARHALGLLLAHQGNIAEALGLLRQAHEMAPDNARYAYVYAIALHSTGAAAQAVAELEQAHQLHPNDTEILVGLVSVARENRDLSAALSHARELAALDPANMRFRMLLLDLERRQAQ